MMTRLLSPCRRKTWASSRIVCSWVQTETILSYLPHCRPRQIMLLTPCSTLRLSSLADLTAKTPATFIKSIRRPWSNSHSQSNEVHLIAVEESHLRSIQRIPSLTWLQKAIINLRITILTLSSIKGTILSLPSSSRLWCWIARMRHN